MFGGNAKPPAPAPAPAARETQAGLALFALSAVGLLAIWFATSSAWLHPELLGTAAYVWNDPAHDGFWTLLRKVFDWKAFDPNVNRVRPLNDLAEVIDAMARPFLARVFGPHPSAMPSAWLTALLAPWYLCRWFRLSGQRLLLAFLATALLLSTTGFLSLVVAYIRPAKKLNLVLLCAALYYAARFAVRGDTRSFAAMYACILASCLSDELGLGNFVIVGIFYWREIFQAPRRRFLLGFLSLPFVFLAITRFLLPSIYQLWSVHGAWDALGDSKKFTVFLYLLQPKFYLVASEALARSLMATVAIARHTPATEILTLVIFVSLPVLHLARRKPGWRAALADRFVLASLVLVLVSTFATLLDWYPFPYRVSYLGSFNYYYHSSIAVCTVIWFTFALQSLWPALSAPAALPSRSVLALGAAGGLIILANFVLFTRINHLVQVIHLYPYHNSELWASVREAAKLPPGGGTPAEIRITGDSDRETREFVEELHRVFGSDWAANGYYRVMFSIAPHPIMTPDHVAHLLHASLPWTLADPAIEQRGLHGWTYPPDPPADAKTAPVAAP